MNRKITLLLAFASITNIAFSQINFVNKANTLTPRGAAACGKDDDFAYIVNGFTTSGANTSELEKYTFASNSWSTITTSIPIIAKRFGNAEVLAGSMYIYNGSTSSGLNNKVEIVNLANGAVTVSTALNPYPTSGGGSAVWGDRLLSFGGCVDRFNAVYSNILFFVNPWSTWDHVSDMPFAAEAKGEVVYGNGDNSKLYVFGGYNEANATTQTFETLTAGSNVVLTDWSNVAEAGTKLYKGNTFNSNKYAEITAYDAVVANQQPSNVSWLVSNAISASGTDPVFLNFDTKDAYNNGATLQAYLVTGWTGNIATSTKTLLNATIASGSTTGIASYFTNSGDVALTGNLTEFRIAFKYVGGYSPSVKTTTYQIDNVRVYKTHISNSIYVYNFATNSWTTSATVLPQSLSAYGIAKDDATDKIYITGDYSNQTFTGVFNPANNSFTTLTQTNMIGRRHHTSEVWNGSLYIFGGNTTSSTSTSLSSVQSASLAPLGLADSTAENTLSVYPNPVKDILNIASDEAINKVAVYNVLGQEVITKSLSANEGSIDVSGLQLGTYFVKVNEIRTVKVIKQ
ncbi:T9SS type A sorting domain-containing protein [Flavobacterium wongokense]|uniref:T9SS type A sorting domain-containing protein n=1 Tax=Flavobacterium wongokense TaxID=2910674 RepID=UPI001F3066AF|nr:T9SS type A sorting domain-containing protein [Flavobacterium sp. WG47]MCF6131701.1 T9SS type A sorting domain-containing protein [Flavobacterium sp. WG47]